MTNVSTVDFETEAIVKGSPTPPKPVGVAIKMADNKGVYLAWGHPTENNCTRKDALSALNIAIDNSDVVVFHNAKFDLAVMQHWLDIVPEIEVADTMIMAFLINPHEKSLGLKQLADKLLDMPPDEQTELRDWILENVPEAKDKTWGAFIAKAPGDLVGKYAIGDVDRTYGLYNRFIQHIEADHEKLSASS